jgi:hypothetical protein
LRVAKSIAPTFVPSASALATRLTLSKNARQSAFESSRMLMITLRTDTWVATCDRCSA